jgi:hypothetical protein
MGYRATLEIHRDHTRRVCKPLRESPYLLESPTAFSRKSTDIIIFDAAQVKREATSAARSHRACRLQSAK